MLSYSGAHVTQGSGAPSIRDVSVQSMRIVRFNGAGRIFWPIGMHMLFVADIVTEILKQPQMEFFAQAHDVAEASGIGDICRPMKTDDQRELEHRLMKRWYRSVGIREPKEAEIEIVKKADNIACNVEGASGCGPRGYAETQTNFSLNKLAQGLLGLYLADYNPMELLNADGRWPLEYERRMRNALRKLQGSAPEDLARAA